MATFLFDLLVFGPVKSRRLGRSLGVNLLPTDAKFCNFNCAYCECGWTPNGKHHSYPFPQAERVTQELEERLISLKESSETIDAITFAGNGEPTLHPSFLEIMKNTISLRNIFFPTAQVAVLSNATKVQEPKVREALLLADIHMLKLDAGRDKTFRLLNDPPKGFTLAKLMENLSVFKNGLVIQSLFVKGNVNGTRLDNTDPEEIDAWLKLLEQLKPEKVIIYSIERETAATGLQKVLPEELEFIAKRVRMAGLTAEVY